MVRTLAQNSAQAVREIESLIQVSAERVADASRRMSDVEAQCDNLGDMRGALGRLDGPTQQNAALVEESAASAESMREQADQEHALVGVFRLSEEAAGA